MSTPINPSNIMIYKIVRDFKHSQKTVHFLPELEYICKQVIEQANLISDENFWILQTKETNDDILKICDIEGYAIVFNKEKYLNGGNKFAKTKIGNMPYPLLKASVKTIKEIESARKNSNSTCVEVHYPDGDVHVSGLCHNCGKIVIEDLKKDDLSK